MVCELVERRTGGLKVEAQGENPLQLPQHRLDVAMNGGQTLTAGGGDTVAPNGIRDGIPSVMIQGDGTMKEVWNCLAKRLQENLRLTLLGSGMRLLQQSRVRRSGVQHLMTSKSACFPIAYSCRHLIGRRCCSRGIPGRYHQ